MRNKETIRQRIKSRLKGLAALAIAVVMVVSMLPVTEAQAAETGNYYFAISYGSYDGILGYGTVAVTQPSDFAYKDSSGNPKFQSGITELGTIGTADNSAAITINPEADTTFYYGGVQSGGFRIYLDGTEKTTGYNWYGKYSSFALPAGKYTVQHTSSIREDSQRTWKIEINKSIESIKLSSSSLNFTIGDASQKLTVDPSTVKVEWKTGDENVATVDNEGNVKPVGVGETEITATLTTDESVKATCKVNVKAKEKPAATIDKAPTARTLTYTGSAQELVTAGEATGGEMQYAIGENATTVPTSGWSRSIPTGTEVKTYYVWYKVKGDDSHSDSKAASVESTIKGKDTPEIKNDSTLPEAEKDKEYSVKLELKDTTVQNTDWSVTDGSMPEGLSLDSKTGVISGTPTKAGEYAFTIKEKTSDAEKKFSLTVKSKGGPEIKNDSTLPEAEQDKEYSVTLELNDSTVKDTDWAVTDGTLPEGLSLDSKTGKISGTPSKAGKYVFTAKEKNTGAEKEFTINVKTSSSTIDTKGDVGLDAVQSEENLQVLEGSVDNLSEEEQQKVKEAKEQGKDLAYEFETEGLNEDDAEGAPEIKDYNNEKGLTMGKVFDISLLIKVKDTGDTLGKMRRLNGKVKFAVSIPEEFRSEGRTFYILRFHDKVDEVGKGQGDEVEAESDLFSTYAISYTDSEDPAPDKKKSKSHKTDDSEEHKTASWILNPNEKQQLVITYTGTPAYLTAGYQEQGAAATELFKAAVPAGWVKAFSFNVLDQKRQPELSVKNGIMVLYIPGEYIKANRQFALLGMNKAGQVILFSDTDQNPNTVTVNLANMDGYAFELIYKD